MEPNFSPGLRIIMFDNRWKVCRSGVQGGLRAPAWGRGRGSPAQEEAVVGPERAWKEPRDQECHPTAHLMPGTLDVPT